MNITFMEERKVEITGISITRDMRLYGSAKESNFNAGAVDFFVNVSPVDSPRGAATVRKIVKLVMDIRK